MPKLSVTIAVFLALAIPLVARAQDGVALSKQLEASLKAKNDKRRLLESFETDDRVEQKWSSEGKEVQVFVCVFSSPDEATHVMELARVNVASAAVKERLPGFGDDAYLISDSRGTSAWLGVRRGKRYVVIHSSLDVAKKFGRDISDYLARN